jgi:hypothetical protein
MRALRDEAGGLVVDGGPSLRGWHYYEAFIRCPRLWARSYALRDEYGPLQEHSPVLALGTLVHLGVGQWRARRIAATEGAFPLPNGEKAALRELAKPIPAMQAYAHQQRRRGGAPPAAACWLEVLPRALAGLRAYVEKYAAVELYDYFCIEEQLTATVRGGGWLPVGEPMLYTQRLDWAGRGQGDGKVWLFDVKTTARWNRQVLARYTLSGQFLGYQRLGRQLYGDSFGGVIVDTVQTTPPYTVRRDPLPPAPEALPRFLRDVAWHERQRRELVAMGIPPEDWPGRWSEFTCQTPYGPCPAHSWCSTGDTGAT